MLNHNKSSPVRVLIVEDSLLQLHIIKSVLDADDGIDVVGTAVNGAEALKLLLTIRPDVICTDYHMPVMDGLEFIKRALEIYPCPILVLSISVQPHQVDNIFKLLSAGAIDVMAKPKTTGGVISKEDGKKLIEKIQILSGVKYIRPNHNHQSKPELADACLVPRLVRPKAILIGASTGGPQALEAILPNLHRQFPIPIICVQHISNGFLEGMLEWLSSITYLSVEIAQLGDIPKPGHLYFPPEGRHLVVESDGRFNLLMPTAEEIYCPSINRLFNSAAQAYAPDVVALLLSGMGEDGVAGINAVYKAGGMTLAQDEGSSIIFGMPAAAILSGSICKVLHSSDIAAYLNELLGNGDS